MKTVKRRGKREGPTHRLGVTMSQASYDMLQAKSEKNGLTIAALVRQVIDRSVAAGLLDADTPSSPQGAVVVRGALLEQYYQLVEKLQRSHEKETEGLTEHLAIKDQLLAQMQRGLEEYTKVITEQAATIKFYEKERVTDVPED